jgi:hypothetical protein
VHIDTVIEDYDDLRVSEILPLLPELYDDELEVVRDIETNGANRASILNEITRLLTAVPTAQPPVPKQDEIHLPTRDDCLHQAHEYLIDVHEYDAATRQSQATVAMAWTALAAEIRADDEKFERLRASLQDPDNEVHHS